MFRGQQIIQAILFVGILYFYIPTTGLGSRATESDKMKSASIFALKSTLSTPSQFVPSSQSLALWAIDPIAAQNSADLLFNEGMQLYIQGEVEGTIAPWREAIEKWEAARSLAVEQGDLQTQTLSLSLLGATYTHLGELDKAVAVYREVLPLYEAQNDRHSQANILTALGQLYTRLGQFQAAIDTSETAQSIWQEIDYRTGEAIVLDDLGTVFARLGDTERALTLYDRALAIAGEVNEGAGYEASILVNEGAAYADLQEYQTAREKYDRALAIWEELEGTGISPITIARQKAATLNNVGYALRQQGEDLETIELYERALPLWQQVGDRLGEASTLTNLGVAYANLGDATQALDFYDRALPLRQVTGDRRGEAETLYRIARAERERGNTQEALEKIERAIEIVESLRSRNNITSERLRTRYFATVQDFYEFYIDLLMELHQQQSDAGYDGKALHASERTRTRTLLELLGEAGIEIRQGVDPQLGDRERSLQQQINTLAQRQTTLLSGDYTEEQATELAAELKGLFEELDSTQTEIRRRHPDYAALTQPQPLDLAAIQEEVLDDETLLLQYFLGEERSYVWAISTDGITSAELPPKGEIELAVRNFRMVMTSARQRERPEKVAEVVRALSDMVTVPVAERFEGRKRLAVSGDGALQYIPMAGLTASATEEIPLAIDYEIVNLPSASALATMRARVEKRDRSGKTMALIADPVFGGQDDPRLQNLFDSNEVQIADGPEDPLLVASARDIGLAVPPTRLPGTEREAQTILSLLPEDAQTIEAIGFDANRAMVISEELKEYQTIHFATHGFFNSSNPGLSGLVLSLLDRAGTPQNGFLRLHDIYNLDWPAELLVLSACQTGLGQEIKGEGVVGLTRGFMYAGIPRMVVSLWSVDDRGTAALMSAFYRHLLQEGRSPSEALRAAQVELQQQEEWDSPYYWSA
ncbi:MAG: CHAT domain-containing tetratricopeptide repeat protein, partial [Cyanobacteriota bacterium]|nr:CHAT domain-containing tetratricopeptide repeat protein [Cyanobacteriota bacterium]